MELINVKPIGFANFIAAVAGSSVAFLGNRYFTFRAQGSPVFGQLIRFGVLYALGALWHGGGLYFWSDVEGWDYRIGFVLVTGLQVIALYIGNRFLVFGRWADSG